MLLGLLTRDERDFLAAIMSGQTAKEHAEAHHYSEKWAEWTSGKIRSKLGVKTMREAIRLAEEDGVSRADFDKLTRLVESTNDAVSEFLKNSTPQNAAAVKERELDEKELAKRLGISLEDVNKIRDEQDYTKYKGYQERLDAERAAAAADDDSDGGADDDDNTGSGGGILDGLGGLRNLRG